MRIEGFMRGLLLSNDPTRLAGRAIEGDSFLSRVHHESWRWLNRGGRTVSAMDPISTARYGMMAATQRLAASASRVARMAGEGEVDYASEAVARIEAKQAFKANVAVIKVADQMWDSLLALQR